MPNSWAGRLVGASKLYCRNSTISSKSLQCTFGLGIFQNENQFLWMGSSENLWGSLRRTLSWSRSASRKRRPFWVSLQIPWLILVAVLRLIICTFKAVAMPLQPSLRWRLLQKIDFVGRVFPAHFGVEIHPEQCRLFLLQPLRALSGPSWFALSAKSSYLPQKP
jgi:hypothetical protein